MQNPNATAAVVSSQAVIAAEQLVSTYLNASVGPFWSQEIMAAGVALVLYIGRHGIKAALSKVAGTAKSAWTGPTPSA